MAWWFSGGGSKAIINVMSVWQTGLEPVWGEGLGCAEGMDANTRVRMGSQPMRLHNRYLAYTCATHKCAPVLGRGERVWKRSSVDAYRPIYLSTYPFHGALWELMKFYFRSTIVFLFFFFCLLLSSRPTLPLFSSISRYPKSYIFSELLLSEQRFSIFLRIFGQRVKYTNSF